MAQTVPVSTADVQKEIRRFIKSPTPSVLCIRGAWGVGKTFIWNKILSEQKAANEVALPKYAYVSLFGIQTLDELKYSVFENTITKSQIGQEPSLQTLRDNTEAVLSSIGRRFLHPVMNVVPFFKGAASSVQTLSFLSVKDSLVCFDDLERKGEKLRTVDVFGLISLLKEHRNCKCVLILNDEKLGKDDANAMESYQEKVIDLSLLFAPNEIECAAIALANTEPFHAPLAERIISLGISNIRVIRKIESLVSRVAPLLSSFHPSVLSQAIQTLTLLGWAHFGRVTRNDSLLIDFIFERQNIEWHGQGRKQESPKHEKEWEGLLDTYGFGSIDDFDLILWDGVKNGFYNEEQIASHAAFLSEKKTSQASQKSLEEAFSGIHDSFDNDTEKVLADISSAFHAHIQYVRPANLNAYMLLLRDLGRDEIAIDALNYFLSHRDEERSFYDIESYRTARDLIHPALKEAFEKKLKSFETEFDPSEVLERILKNQSWSNADIAGLSILTVEDYKSLFKRLRGTKMRNAVRAAIGFRDISNRGADYETIINNATQALREIAAESPMNNRRVNRLVGVL